MRKLFFFVIAGSAGFLTDAGVLSLMLAFTPVGPFVARVFAIATAMGVTYLINRSMTFGRSNRPVAEEGARYVFVGLIGALVNYAIYAALLLSFPEIQPVIALTAASLAAMLFSFVGYSRFVFRR